MTMEMIRIPKGDNLLLPIEYRKLGIEETRIDVSKALLGDIFVRICLMT